MIESISSPQRRLLWMMTAALAMQIATLVFVSLSG